MRRLPLAFLKATAIVLLGLFGTVAGSVAAVFLTPAGRGLAGRTLSEQLDALVQGDIEVGSVGGPLWSGLEVDRLVVRDTTGEIVLEADRLAADYRLVDLLAGRIVLHDVTLSGLRATLEKKRNGSWNFTGVFRRATTDTTVAGPPPLVRITGLTLRGAEVKLLEPWDPPDSMRTPALAARALAEDRDRPGRVIEAGPEGYRKVVTFERLGGRFALLQLVSPTHDPLRAEFDSLGVRVSDPAVQLTDATGKVRLAHDSLSVQLTEARLPSSRLSADGTVLLGAGGPRFDIRARAPQVAFRDLRGFVPGLPDLAGSARATLRTRADGRLAASVDDLDAAGRQGRVAGRLTAVTGAGRELAFERLDLQLTGMDPQALSGWLDSLPLRGTVDGHVTADGPLGALAVTADVIYRDARVPGRPANRLDLAGRLRLGGADGMVFDTLALRSADLDLGTVTVLVPSNPLVGRANLEGDLVGPWRRVTWRGTALHRDGDRPVSAVRGTVFLDIRGAVPAFDVDVGLMPVVLDGLRGTWPGLTAQGDLRGTVHLRGTSERFALDADLHGQLGHLAGSAVVRSTADAIAADSLAVRFDSLDLASLGIPRAPSQLLGTLEGSLRRDTAGLATGRLSLLIGRGWIREVPLDSAALLVTADSTLLRVDTGFVRWPGGRLEAGGTLARTAPATGSLHLEGSLGDLGVFDSLVTAFAPADDDTTGRSRPLSGRLDLVLDLSGALDSVAFDGRGALRDVEWRLARLPAGHIELRYAGGARGAVAAIAAVDTASWEGLSLAGTEVRASGRRDSLAWGVAGRLGPTDTVVAGGSWRTAPDTMDLRLDSLRAILTAHTWRLAAPAAGRRLAGTWSVDSLALLAEDGSGELRLRGVLPGASEGDATLTALGVDLRDLMGLFQRDTVGILGRAAADLSLGGTARAPTLRGTFSLAEGGYREFRAPYLQGALRYADRRLETTVLLWRTGRPALTIAADTLPLDLALTGVKDRKLPGPLYIRATADSADLGLLEAFTKNLRRVRGALDADVTLTGQWNDVVLGGRVKVTDAAATIPGLGVRWEGMNALVHLRRDSVVIDSLSARGGLGTLTGKGSVRFERGRAPQLAIDLSADRFRAMDVRNYLALTTTLRDVKIRGPLFGATLTGQAQADEGALYFADLVTKQIVDLDDPTTADLIDTALVREARLGPSFSNRFIDSLRVNDLVMLIGDDFWLRSTDANIKLTGRARVNKVARNYRVDGTLTAERGQYTFKLGVTKNFDVDRGTVRFLGTPDLNAELDLTAHHQVKPTDGSREFQMQARITGTLLVPKLTLVNPDNPQMTETDMVSYLMFGRSSSALQGSGTRETIGQQLALNSAIQSYLLPAISSEIERTLISDLGVPVDYIQIRPGGFGQNAIEGPNSGLTTLSAGWRLGRRTYVSLNAGICNNNASDVSYRNFGASLEQRLHPDWRATLSVEPVFTCSTAPGSSSLATSSLYQLGLDLLWDREY
ncbi:MAG TPA: translocation/assembly module TamB domain-containing protein [Gemmatimonadales bacterium]|nr:translocation/assembly module TamB domain-containing protein [Gemmatimonadales bacterium]